MNCLNILFSKRDVIIRYPLNLYLDLLFFVKKKKIYYLINLEKNCLILSFFINLSLFINPTYNLCCIYYVTMYVDSQIVPYNMYSKDGMKRWRSEYKI